ncbi:hypothetical protein H2O64_21240 [Kordia sp. YSTF-M3]|uniref:Natural product n=1 Tax=Kordia aestuariivivens TaxID=2759037 RepID=A0ABR7QF98_9FLAO|nr:hypothetical protein [Kordia aestuariivivens]MBC8757209.1 hypothetical protein [Kordia aestuariivivens]
MKKRNLKKLRLNKKSISRIQENAISGGDVSLPNPATGVLCDLTGANFCLSWQACNTRPENITCVFTVGPGTGTIPPITENDKITNVVC